MENVHTVLFVALCGLYKLRTYVILAAINAAHMCLKFSKLSVMV